MKITIAQINGIVGDFKHNADHIIDIIEKYNGKSDLIIFPELAVSSYPILDLIQIPNFYEEQIKQLDRIAQSCTEIACVIGYFSRNDGYGKPFFNSLAFIHDGKIAYSHNKTTLPVYNIFDEARFFESGNDVGIYKYKDINIGLLICEEIWSEESMPEGKIYNKNPIKETVDAGADILISVNASPSHVDKPEYRINKFSEISKKYNTPLIYCNCIGGQDDLVFDGTSFAVNRYGDVYCVLKSFEEDMETFDITRCENKILLGYADGRKSCLEEEKNRPIMTPSEFYFKQIVLGIKDYTRKCGFKKAVIASSGGVDSALVIALAVEALGSKNVEAITMPSAISSVGSVSDSIKLCNNLGIKLYTYPIKDQFNILLSGFEEVFGKSQKSITKENMQARIRGLINLCFSNEYSDFLVLNTGNKSEISTGFFTLGGDGEGGIAVIGDLYKTEIWDLCRYVNKIYGKEIIPNDIINKDPSAELYEGQRDIDSLPPYKILDAILKIYIEKNDINPFIREECKNIIKDIPLEVIKKIHRLVDRSEFKRRQIPHVIRVHQKAFGFGRRFPIAQKYVER